MGFYFLDSSAVVKRYAPEPGTQWVDALCDQGAGNTVAVSQAALVEVVAALCRKARLGTIDDTDRDRAIAVFRRDARRGYTRVRVTSAIYRHAGDLCRVPVLRAYDAIQLACVLALRDRLVPLGLAPIFVCADASLLTVAINEGLGVDNPNVHPRVDFDYAPRYVWLLSAEARLTSGWSPSPSGQS